MIQDVVRTLATIACCSRRRETLTEKKQTTKEEKSKKVPVASAPPFMLEEPEKTFSDSDDNTGTSTTSYEPRTDPALGSSDSSFDSSDASDLEMEAHDAEQKLRSMKLPVPPGFKPPPGLEFAYFSDDKLQLPAPKLPKTRLSSRAAPFVSAPGTRLSSHAAPFLPKNLAPGVDSPVAESKFMGATQHLQETLIQLKGALAVWEATMPKSDGQELNTSVAATASFAIGAASAAMDAVPTAMQGPQSFIKNAAMTPPLWPTDFQQSWQNSVEHYNEAWCLANHQVPVPVSIADCLSTQTLRDNLRALDQMDPSLIVIVRRINRLGLESPTWLRTHFSLYGVVDKVLVAHSRSSCSSSKFHSRVRPAGLGFIVMSTAAEVKAILWAGREHNINGVGITVQSYESRMDADVCEEAPADKIRFQ